ncbi:MAG: hypothetical protein HHJ11_00775 [Phycicoccus sp.]|nr:hypothetical protein [Phycicoccus sp.]NMM35158.1 hypothetical protein [Phycicoccus sp.]
MNLGAGMGSFAVLLLALGIAIAAGLSLAVGGTHVSVRDVAWIAGTPESSPAEVDVYSRYLQRHRRHRMAGGLLGALFAVILGGRWYGSITIGVGQQNPLADVLFCGLGGVLVGAFSAESFRLSEPASTTVSASLAEHAGASRPDVIRAARGICLASLVGGGLVAATGHGLVPLWIAIGGLIATLVAEATQAAITGRRRPVLSDRAQAVDLRMRSFASTSVARLELAVAVLTAAWTVSKVPGAGTGPFLLVQDLTVIAGFVITLVLLHRASPRPPRKWSSELS